MATKSETFRNIYYSDKDAFDISDNRVSLKKYKDDLIFYTNFDSTLNATYYKGNKVPIQTGTNSLENFGVFSQHVNIQGTIEYGIENFVLLQNEGSIKFRVRTGFNNGICYQETKNVLGTIVAGTYTFDVYTNNNLVKQCSIDILLTDTIVTILAKINTALEGTIVTALNALNKIRFIAGTAGDIIEIRNGTLFTLFGGIQKPIIPNAPTENVTFLSLTNKIDNRNKITITHTTASHIIVEMYNSLGEIIVSKDFGIFSNIYTNFYAFELTWSDSTISLFIDGKLVGVEPIELIRENIQTYLILQGSVINTYKIDELIIFNKIQNYKSYNVETVALTPYSTNLPYIDIDFGNGFKEEEVKDLNIISHPNCNFVVKMGNTWYYYFSGGWRKSDGSFNQSNSPGTLETKFRDLYFNVDASLIIRVYFESDGNTECWIDDISIISESGDEKAAIITGTVIINTVDLSINNKVKINTDQGSLEVNVASTAVNTAAVTLEEIKQAINNAHVPGLDLAKDDGYGHLVLQSISTGKDAFVSISEAQVEDCLELIWGYETTDLGEDAGVVNIIDYSPLFDYVRLNLGAPIVPVELTDEQLEACLLEAVNQFNKYRNSKESIYYMNLVGNANDGYDVPAIIGGPDFIIDIIVKPRMPFGYFSASGEMASNIYIQYLFHKYGRPTEPGFLTDYSLFLSFEKDMNLILGTEPRWEILNNKLFLYPKPPASGLQIAIKYKAALTIQEIINSQQIKDYVLAKAKIILGTIRSTFGSSIPGGGENIQLNGADLIAQGKEELENVKGRMKGEMEPLGMLIG